MNTLDELSKYWMGAYPATWEKTMRPRQRDLPDLMCFTRRENWAGLALYIQNSPPTTAQRHWIEVLEAEGWQVGWYNDLAVAGDFLDRYHTLLGVKSNGD
jgi:hypothetical protein